MMVPEADQTKHSICPGVSTSMLVTLGARCSSISITWSTFVANRFRHVMIPPLGPRLYLYPPKKLALCPTTTTNLILQANTHNQYASRIQWQTDDNRLDVLLHNFFVVHRVPNVNVALEREVLDRGVKVDNIRRLLLGMEMRVETLHEGCLPRACKKQRKVSHWLMMGEEHDVPAMPMQMTAAGS